MLQVAKDSLSSTRLEILSYLLVNSNIHDESRGCSIKEIANTFDLSPNAIRQYLIELEKDQLVVRKKKKGKTGRPAMTYFLHNNALGIFPKSYADFSIRLLDHVIKNYGEEDARRLLIEIGREKGEEMKTELSSNLEENAKSLRERLTAVINIFKKYGRFPEIVEEEDSFILKNHNCLIYDIVQNHPVACIVDETQLSELLGRKVDKVQCLSEGEPFCIYRINKANKSKSSN
ncbi:MAG: Rrf2 family transcriptional regulator [Candidatus Heimdallarchaeota archaeon]|nr:MAG: Rrf2 family transcriptional regulator [Candidatus Heimdallarchaeota archaeon]